MAFHYEIQTSGGEFLEEDDGSVDYASAEEAKAAATKRAEELKSAGNIPDDGKYRIKVSEESEESEETEETEESEETEE